MKLKALIPNGLTSLNLVFGVCSIITTIHGNLYLASLFILFALVADGLDGRAARYFGVSSEIGKEMDSLCDLVSFGVAPSIIAHCFVLHGYGIWGWFAPIVFALCGAWRLARFNVNVGIVHGFFMGVAIPAGGCFIATSTLMLLGIGADPKDLGFFYPLTMTIVAFLMVSEIHYPDFKGKGEKIYPVAKILAAVMFAAIIYVGHTAPIEAVLFAVFATYIAFGIINTICASLLGGKK